MRSVGFFQGLRGAKAPYLRRSCPRLQNFSSGAARALLYLRRVLQGLRKIRRALVRLRNMSTAVARASKNRRGGLPGVGASVFPKASERTPKLLRRSWPHLQNFSSGPARAARYLQRALQGLTKIRRALHRPRNILLCNCEKSRAERASRKLEQRQIFPRGEGSTYLRRSCPRLQNFRAARASIYLRRVLQGLQKIRRALVRPLGILRGKQKLWKVSS